MIVEGAVEVRSDVRPRGLEEGLKTRFECG